MARQPERITAAEYARLTSGDGRKRTTQKALPADPENDLWRCSICGVTVNRQSRADRHQRDTHPGRAVRWELSLDLATPEPP